ncbi:MAG: type II toxin-antitoxin system death-on-curing family toxin [Caldisericia bacterium]|nr:type II toxin-antitoxin system death-on-curing family toxin [Caldisericia bacterium]
MDYIYVTFEQALKTYAITIKKSGGGASGFIQGGEGKLDSILIHIQNDEYYPKLEDKLAHLFFAVISSHCFVDGNKRIGLTLCVQFLINNGYLFFVSKFIFEMESICLHVAAGRIEKPLLKRLISSILYEVDFDEELKLDYIRAISGLK